MTVRRSEEGIGDLAPGARRSALGVAGSLGAALVTALAVACAPAGGVAAGAAPAAAPAGHVVLQEFRGAAGTRRYELYVPAGERRGPRPLVVMLHGCTQTAADFARGTRMNALADSAGALVLYPEQDPAANPQRCWNWYDAGHQGRDAGEPAIIAELTRDVAARYGADAGRTYVAGISAGGAMALTLAATHPDLFEATGVHSGVPFAAARDVAGALVAMRGGAGEADPAAVTRAMGERRRLVPLFVVHGAADAVVSEANGRAIVRQWVRAMESLRPGTTFDSRHALTRDAERTHTLNRFGEGDPAPVEFLLVDGLGHAWSGGSPEGTYTDPKGPDASRALLRFLLAHRMPEAR